MSRILNIFTKNCGIEKIRITGGEPTIHKNFFSYSKLLQQLPLVDRGITTNGLLLTRHAELIRRTYNLINISLDTLDREKFELISNRSAKFHDRIIQGIGCVASGNHQSVKDVTVKLNTVMMKGVNDDELLDLIRFSSSLENTSIRFIELMPFNGNREVNKLFMSRDEILSTIRAQFGEEIEMVKTDDQNSSTGIFEYSVNNVQFGIISSMTNAFCGTCNRIRLTSDGKLRNCLFSNFSDELDLFNLIDAGATDNEIEEEIRKCIYGKFFSHGGRETIEEMWDTAGQNRSMIQIGG